MDDYQRLVLKRHLRTTVLQLTQAIEAAEAGSDIKEMLVAEKQTAEETLEQLEWVEGKRAN